MRGALVVCALAACGSDPDPMPDLPATWQLLHQGDHASLLSVWGTSASDVWAVGNRNASGAPTIYRYDGTAWAVVDSQQTSLDLWWVWGIGDDVWFGGTGGTILRYRDGVFEKLPTPRASGTVFGMWGGAADDIWAVGQGGAAGGIVWHWDGAEWTAPTLDAALDVPSTVFKVHGRATDDVWFSGANGFAMHWTGELSRVPSGTTAPLFSVGVTNDVAIVVGGQTGDGELRESTGGDFTRVNLPTPYRWRGAAASGDRAFAVGEYGVVAERDKTGWTPIQQSVIQRNFHAAWIDPDGGMWGVGGNFDMATPNDGFLVYYGKDTIPEVAL